MDTKDSKVEKSCMEEEVGNPQVGGDIEREEINDFGGFPVVLSKREEEATQEGKVVTKKQKGSSTYRGHSTESTPIRRAKS